MIKDFLVPGNNLRDLCVDLINTSAKDKWDNNDLKKMSKAIEEMKNILAKIELIKKKLKI
ncbi:hypothetical protein COV12_02045 [Candidatus Woesearchaeota archaeon CG10_big_fil_rev_8_21_14_0_10_32_24]|nr:MAG: hypothetical protein COV12_02045 [Candidatus Woesearchaeota archaeon CG10_big_fil_rev_8_21_14_0_10_32_24]